MSNVFAHVEVKVGTHILSGEKVAVKILEKDRIVDVADVERQPALHCPPQTFQKRVIGCAREQ
eukprot:3268841-Amphidinium_carterae.1